MAKLGYFSGVLTGCVLATSLAMVASAQPRGERDWDRGREWRDRDQGRERDRDWRDRDRDWDSVRRWRDRDCYYETRRDRNRFGEVIVRRYRVCEE